ncbi:AP-5 complex subunit zeta-1 [Rhynchospora pubera]|uniref:AP-5 complex subunit zeta-1 n=1 Tax=Rhynchospora pubera TaxID=906938 RepID=A0AAV8HL88_9POAL|nr:AP-5 complex subunit zeta-1 [Rhynchospora pubera]
MAQSEGDFEFYLRSLSSQTRDSSSPDPSSDPYLLPSVTKIYEMCKEGGSDEMVTRAFNQMSKLYQRCISVSNQSQTSNGVLLLTMLQFFLDFGDVVLHDTDSSLRSFFRSCLSREFAHPVVAGRLLEFLNFNKKILKSFPALLPQFFPLLLKLIAWNGESLEKPFLSIVPLMISAGSFLPLFSSLIDLPLLVVALEKVEKKNSGTLIGSSIASIQKSAAPEMLLALMDEAYTGSAIENLGDGTGLDDNGSFDLADPSFLEILKDENDGIAERHWTSPTMATTLRAAVNNPQSDRLKQTLRMSPHLLGLYFSVALREINDSLLCALIPLLMSRYDTMCPDKTFCFEVRKRLSDFMLAVFQRCPHFIALLKKPIMDRLAEAYDSPAKTELGLHLCWAIGEHGAGGTSYKDVARVLFESLELLLYENLATSRLGLNQESAIDPKGNSSGKSSQARLLCFVVTAIAKLATCHNELLPRARVSLAKVARSKVVDRRVWQRACDYLGLMDEPALCMSVLGPPTGEACGPGIVDWSKGDSKMVAHIPFYLLAEQEGIPYHDFSFGNVFPVDENPS